MKFPMLISKTDCQLLFNLTDIDYLNDRFERNAREQNTVKKLYLIKVAEDQFSLDYVRRENNA